MIDTTVSFGESTAKKTGSFENELDDSSKEFGTTWDAVLKDEIVDCVFGRTFGDYQIGELIAKGSQGNVYKGLNLKSGRFVAIKEVDLRKQDYLESVPNILLEIDLLKELHHPNLVGLIDYHLEEKKFLHIVLEYIENGSLKDILQKFGYFREALASKYAFQLLQGLNYLHDKDVIHRDIKGANILMTKDGVCKLAVAMKITPYTAVSGAGSTYWMAPEILEMKEATKASDVWSFGITVLELLTGSPPYFHLRPNSAILQIVENERPPFPSHISNDCDNFLNGIFRREPKERLTFKELLNHPWITSYNNTNFNEKTLKNLKESLCININATDDNDLLSAIKASAAQKPNEFLAKIIQKNEKKRFQLLELDTSTLKEKIASFQLENDLLSTITHSIHQELLQVEDYNKTIVRNIDILEDNFVTSDVELARLIYGEKLSMAVFNSENVSKGVLMTCKIKSKNQSSKLKWSKRWVVLQDNFLFFYKEGDENQEPVDILKLKGVKIDVNADINRKYSFELTSGSTTYYLSAASAAILMKWINLLQNISDWTNTVDLKLPEKKPTTPRKLAQDFKKNQRKSSLTHNISSSLNLHQISLHSRKTVTDESINYHINDHIALKSLPNLPLPLGVLSPRYSNTHKSRSLVHDSNPILSPRYTRNNNNNNNNINNNNNNPMGSSESTSPRSNSRSFKLFNSLTKKKKNHTICSSTPPISPRENDKHFLDDENDDDDDDLVSNNESDNERPNRFIVNEDSSNILQSLVDSPKKKEKLSPLKKFDTVHPIKNMERKRLSAGKFFASNPTLTSQQ